MTPEERSRALGGSPDPYMLRLTPKQMALVVGTISAVFATFITGLGQWYRMESRMSVVEEKIEAVRVSEPLTQKEADRIQQRANEVHERLEDRIENIERKLGIRASGGRR